METILGRGREVKEVMDHRGNEGTKGEAGETDKDNSY